MGYKDNSPYRNAPSLMIDSPNGTITMDGVSKDLIGIDEYGNRKVMKANSGEYRFKGSKVKEIPIAQAGGELSEGMSGNLLGGIQGGVGLLSDGVDYLSNKNTMNNPQKGKSLGSMIGGGLGLASMAFGVPPTVGMAIGSKLGGAVGGVVGNKILEKPVLQTVNTVGIPKAKTGGLLNQRNMNFREKYNDYQSGGALTKNYQGGGLVSGEGAMPHSQGGVPTVDETGQQIAEVEGGERIFSVEDTAQIEQMVQEYSQTNSPELAQQGWDFVVQAIMKQEQVNPSETGVAGDTSMQQPMMEKGGKFLSKKGLFNYWKNDDEE